MKLNGRDVIATGTILDTCIAHGVHVPALCFNARVSIGAHCRSCLVEVDGRWLAACTTAAHDGMRVETATTQLSEYRRDLGELILSEASPRGSARAEIASWGADGHRYPPVARQHGGESSHPYVRIDLDACIKCRLCSRACDEIQGQFVYGFEGRGARTRLEWGDGSLLEGGCVSCGACVSVCPSEAISDVDLAKLASPTPLGVSTVQTTCGYCGVGCQLEVQTTPDDVLQVTGAPSPVNHEHLCVKGRYAHGFVRHPDRLRAPLLRKQGQLVPVSWDEATDYVAREMTRLRGSLAGLSSSRCTNEENYLFQKWFRAGLGTHNVDCCARVCHAPSAAGMRWSFGAGAATNCLEDIDLADVLLVAGSNTTESHPVTGARIKRRALQGVPLIVVDPRRTELAKLADVHLQLRPGTNVPLLNSLLYAIIREGYVDLDFVNARTEGFAELETHLEPFAPENTAAKTGVPAELVHRAAHLLGRAQSPLQVHGLGITEHHQGSETVMLLCNLAMLLGAVGRPGVGVNPLRGQNNVQGSADMGCQPDLLTGYCDPRDDAVRERFESIWQRPMPTTAGLTIPRMYEGVRNGSIRGMYIFGEDVAQTDPDANRVVEALSRLELLVVQELFLSETAKLAHVVLPGASFFEKDGTFTNGERRIQRVRRAVQPAAGSRPDWEILCDLMGKTGYPQHYASPRDIMDEIAHVAPDVFGGVSYARLEGDGLCWPVPNATHPGTTRLHRESFARGLGRFACVEWIPSPSLGGDGPIRLVTGRVLEHYNAGSMTRRTPNAHLKGADFLTIHPVDAERRGIVDNDRVRVTSDFGEALATADVCDDVAPGTAFLSFHFPETKTNQLTSDIVDRKADCPEYKLTLVNVARA